MKTEKEKMLQGELYLAHDPELTHERRKARTLIKQLNDSRPEEEDLRRDILKKLIGKCGEHTWIEPPFFCDYGANIAIGDHTFFNFNCTILDVTPVTIGHHVLVGPNVQIYAATHPMEWKIRSSGKEFGKPVTIGSHVWIGGGAIICPGVHIGNGAVIGAGSVVTRDIPDNVFAAGNPCREIRLLEK